MISYSNTNVVFLLLVCKRLPLIELSNRAVVIELKEIPGRTEEIINKAAVT